MIHSTLTDDDLRKRICDVLNEWHYAAWRLGFLIVILGTLGIGGSLFVSVFLGLEVGVSIFYFKIISMISLGSITTLGAFNLVNRKNAFRFAWRNLTTAFLLHKEGLLNNQQLIEAFHQAELSIGISLLTMNPEMRKSPYNKPLCNVYYKDKFISLRLHFLCL